MLCKRKCWAVFQNDHNETRCATYKSYKSLHAALLYLRTTNYHNFWLSSNLSCASCGLFMCDKREKFGLENDSTVNFSSLWIGSRHVRNHAQQCIEVEWPIEHTCPGLPTDVQWYIPNCAVLDGLGSYQSAPLATPCPHCPSHPTVPWEGLGSYQSVPLAKLCPSHHIPSHPTVPWELRNRQIPKCPTRYTLSIPSHFTMGRNGQMRVVPDEGCTRWGLYQSVTSAMLCQTCPSFTAVP